MSNSQETTLKKVRELAIQSANKMNSVGDYARYGADEHLHSQPDRLRDWLKNHSCTGRELWTIQNCLGTVFGTEHPVAAAATREWMKQRTT